MKILETLKSSRFRVSLTGAMCLIMAGCEPCCDPDNCDPPFFIRDPKARVFVADEDFSAFHGADTPSVAKAIKGLTQPSSIALWMPRYVDGGCGDCPKLFFVRSGGLQVLDIPADATTPVSRTVNLNGSAVSAIAWDQAPSGFIWATSNGVVIQVDGRAENVAFRLQLPGRSPTLIAMQESEIGSLKGVVLSGQSLVTFDSFGERANANVGTNISDIAINNAYIVAVSLFHSKMYIFDTDLKNMKTIDIATPHHVALGRRSTMAFVSAIRQGQSGIARGVIHAVDVKALTVSAPVLVGQCPADVQLFEFGAELGFVSNECDNTVTKFRLTNPPVVIQDVPVGYGPGFLAVHP